MTSLGIQQNKMKNLRFIIVKMGIELGNLLFQNGHLAARRRAIWRGDNKVSINTYLPWRLSDKFFGKYV